MINSPLILSKIAKKAGLNPAQNRLFWQSLLLAVLFAFTTLASASHVHIDEHGDEHEETGIEYEDCGAFHHGSTDYAVVSVFCFEVESTYIAELLFYRPLLLSKVSHYQPPARAPPAFS